MDIPWQALQPETLRALIEEFVTRDGTDYGAREASLETKVLQIQKLLESGKIKIVFDADSESCNLVEALPPFNRKSDSESGC
jgi:uncharacterized protein YheU (UPF0270 family)